MITTNCIFSCLLTCPRCVCYRVSIHPLALRVIFALRTIHTRVQVLRATLPFKGAQILLQQPNLFEEIGAAFFGGDACTRGWCGACLLYTSDAADE